MAKLTLTKIANRLMKEGFTHWERAEYPGVMYDLTLSRDFYDAEIYSCINEVNKGVCVVITRWQDAIRCGQDTFIFTKRIKKV
jgi:hypothetical protein